MKRAVDAILRGETAALELAVPFGLEDIQALVLRGESPVELAAICEPSVRWGPGTVDGLADPEAVQRHLDGGCTLVLDQLHRQFGPAAVLNRRFEVALSARSRVDAVLVPAGATGPAPDLLDNVIIGLHGSSAFRVGDQDVELGPGQALAVPKLPVEPLVAETLSLYAVVAISRVTWREVLMEAAAAFDDPLAHAEASEGGEQHWRALVARFLEDVDAEEALDRIATTMVATRLPYMPGQLQASRHALDLNTWVGRRPEVMFRIVRDEEACRLLFHSTEMSFIPQAEDLLWYIVEAPAFRPAELPQIPEHARVGFVKTLVDAGFLELREGGEG